MDRFRLAGALVAILLVPAANADRSSLVVDAPVVSVQPIVRTVSERIPHEVCRRERVRVVERGRVGSATPGLVGAVVGGTVASVLGRNSRHQPVIAGAGALLGASIGHDRAQRRASQSYYVNEDVCEVEYERREREEVTGYRVSYRYNGTILHTRSDHYPGDTIPVRVEVSPLR